MLIISKGAPKRAMSAFLSYSQQMRPQIREEFPDLKNTDISGVLAQRWKEASEEEKRPHLEREMREREKYHDDMAKWKLEEREKEKSREEQQYKTTMDYLDLPSAALWDAMTNDDSTNSTKGVYSANVGVPFYQYDGNSFNNAFWDASDNLTDGSCSVSQKSGGASEISDILGKSRKDGSAPRKNNFPREAGGEDGFWNDKVQCGLNAYVDNIDREEETQSRVSAKELDKQRGKTETSLLGNSKYLYHRTIEFYDGSYGPYDSDAYSNDNGSTVASSISSGTTSVGSWYSFDPRYGGNSMNYSNPSQNIVKTTDSAGSVQKDAKYNVHNSKKTTGNINTPLDLYSNPAWTQKSCDLSAISPRANLESLGKYYTSHHQNYLQKNPLSRMNDNSSVEEGKSKNFKVGRKMDEALAGDSMKPPVGSLTKRPRNTVDNLGSLMTATSSFYLSEHPESSTT